MSTEHEQYMRQAIALSEQGSALGDGGPFGALVVKDGRIIGRGWNCVLRDNDPTAHAEIQAIRDACRMLGGFSLEGAVIYASCEPCPMCLAAIYWARLDTLYYAGERGDAAAAGFDDALFYSELEQPVERRTLHMEKLLSEEARHVLQGWAAQPDKILY